MTPESKPEEVCPGIRRRVSAIYQFDRRRLIITDATPKNPVIPMTSQRFFSKARKNAQNISVGDLEGSVIEARSIEQGLLLPRRRGPQLGLEPAVHVLGGKSRSVVPVEKRKSYRLDVQVHSILGVQ